MKKVLVGAFKLLGEFGVISAIVTIMVVIMVLTPPRPIVSVEYHGQDEITAEDVSAVLVWDKTQKRHVPVEEPQRWFAEYQGQYEISYDAPNSVLWEGD